MVASNPLSREMALVGRGLKAGDTRWSGTGLLGWRATDRPQKGCCCRVGSTQTVLVLGVLLVKMQNVKTEIDELQMNYSWARETMKTSAAGQGNPKPVAQKSTIWLQAY